MSYQCIEGLIERKPQLAVCKAEIIQFCDALIECYRSHGKVIVCGNGGSCSDAGHIVGELMKSFRKKRVLADQIKERLSSFGGIELASKLQAPLRAIDLTAMAALNTAIANDIDPNCIFAQQVIGLADPGDVFIGISTSGKSKNVHFAAIAAKAMGSVLVGLTGMDGAEMHKSGIYNVLVCVPENITYRIQEEHMAVYHAVCADTENVLFPEQATGAQYRME
jgi:D-sedoheptulose 7-phosphate isomerase